jgi:hypothetical protein
MCHWTTLISFSLAASLPLLPAAGPDTKPGGGRCEAPSAAVTAPLLMFQDRIFTLVNIGGRDDLLFMIDNGCYYSNIEPEQAEEALFNPISEKTVDSAGKKNVQLDIGRIPEMRIGGLELKDEVVAISPLMPLISRGIGKNVSGIVGMRTLCRQLTTLDFEGGRIIFRPNLPEARREIMEQPGMVVALPCKPMLGTNGHLLTMKIAVNGVEVDAIVDLGFAGGLITNRDPESLGLDRYLKQATFPVAIAGLVGEGHRTWARRVEIGGLQISGLEAIHVDAPGEPKTVIVGVAFLKHFEVTLDYLNQKLILRSKP